MELTPPTRVFAAESTVSITQPGLALTGIVDSGTKSEDSNRPITSAISIRGRFAVLDIFLF
jgi:hypothetical protein